MGKRAKRVDETGRIVNVVPEQPKETKQPKSETPKADIGQKVCPCGCGAGLGKKRVFEQGHDARIRGWFVAVAEGEKEVESMPPILQKAFPTWQENGAGAFVKAAVVAAMAS